MRHPSLIYNRPLEINPDSPQARGLSIWMPTNTAAGYDFMGKSLIPNFGTTFLGGGPAGRAFNFVAASSTYMQRDSTPVVNLPMTISCWMRTPTTSETGGLVGLFDSSSGSDWFLIRTESGQVSAWQRGGGATQRAISPASSIAANTWYHITGQFVSGTERNIFINGELAGNNANSFTTSNCNRFALGLLADSSPSNYFTGDISDVRVYDRALTDLEILDLYNPRTRFDLIKSPNKIFALVSGGVSLLEILNEQVKFPGSGTVLENDANLQGLWTFELGSNLGLDHSSNSNDLTTLGSVSQSSDNKRGQSSALIQPTDTNDDTALYIADGSQTGLEGTDYMSIGGWFKLNSTASDHELITKWGAPPSSYRLSVDSGGTLHFAVYDGTSAQIQVDNALSTGVWYHIVAIHELSVGMSIYIDGILRRFSASALGVGGSARDFAIGSTDDEIASGSGFDSDFYCDEVFFLDRALTGNEVLSIYNPERLTVLSYARLLDETVNISETSLNAFGLTRLLADGINLVETNSRLKGYLRPIDEVENIVETAPKLRGYLRPIGEVVNLVETNLNLIGFIRVLDEAVNINEVIQRLRAYLPAIDEAVNINETTLRPRVLARILDETENLVETNPRLRAYLRAIDEVINLVETDSNVLGIVRVLSEVVNINEVIQRLRAYLPEIDEVVNVNETTLRPRVLARILDEVENIVEASISFRPMVRNTDETINIVEASLNVLTAVTGAILRIISETMRTVDVSPGGIWDFEGSITQQRIDEGGRDHTLELSSGAVADADSQSGAQSYLFTKANLDYVGTSSFSMPLWRGFTFAAWVKMAAGKPTTGETYTIMNLGGTPRFIARLQVTADGSARIQTGTTFGTNNQTQSAAATVVASTWIHLAGRYDYQTLDLFVDGALVNSNAYTDVLSALSGNFTIGARNTTGLHGHDGLIDLATVYARPLADTIIRDLYLNGAPRDFGGIYFLLNRFNVIRERVFVIDEVPMKTRIVRLLSEVVNIVESRANFRGLKHLIAEVVDLVETRVNNLKFQQIVNELVYIYDSRVFNGVFRQIINEAVNIIDDIRRQYNLNKIIENLLEIKEPLTGFSPLLGILQVLSETVNVQEAKLTVYGQLRTISETVNIVEVSPVVGYGYIRYSTEVVNIVEGIYKARAANRIIGDVVTIREAQLTPKQLGRVIENAIHVLETTNTKAALVRAIDETVNIVEGLIRFIVIMRAIDETVDIIESNVSRETLSRIVADVIHINETTVSARILARIYGEIVTIREAVRKPFNFSRTISETVNIVELSRQVGNVARVISEVVNIVEARQIASSVKRVVSEVVNIIESRLTLGNIIRPINEVITIVETRLTNSALGRIINERVIIIEAISTGFGLGRVISETVNIIEDRIRRSTVIRAISETVNILETILGSPVLHTLASISLTAVKIITSKKSALVTGSKRAIKYTTNRKGVRIE